MAVIAERPRVYLNKVHLKGFKSIEDLTIDFQKSLNILIGKNGAGKSNVMEFISLATLNRKIPKLLYRYAELELIADDNNVFSIETEREPHTKVNNEYLSDSLGLLERFKINGQVKFDNSLDDGTRRKFQFNNKNFFYRNNLRLLFNSMGYHPLYSLYLKFNLPDNLNCIEIPGSIKFSTEEDLNDEINYLETLNFINQIIWRLELSYYSAIELDKSISVDFYKLLQIPEGIINNLRTYTNIEDLRFNNNLNTYKDDKHILIENIKLEFKINGNWLPWSQLSDGTKRLFYIISEVTDAQGLVLIEEPELGIHPHQFNLLMDFLKEQSEDKQIIISTHSPKALDHLSQNELNHILIAYYDINKGTQIRHLSDKETKKAQKYMKEVGFFSDYWMLSDLE